MVSQGSGLRRIISGGRITGVKISGVRIAGVRISGVSMSIKSVGSIKKQYESGEHTDGRFCIIIFIAS
jgi:hypothetical protein